MKLPLMLQLLVKPHILFCSVVVGSELYFGALRNSTDVTGSLHCCLSKTKTLERNLYSLFTAFMKPEPLGRIINNSKGLLEVLKQLRSYLIQKTPREQKIRIKKKKASNLC